MGTYDMHCPECESPMNKGSRCLYCDWIDEAWIDTTKELEDAEVYRETDTEPTEGIERIIIEDCSDQGHSESGTQDESIW